METVLLMVLIAVVSELALWKVRAIMSRRAAKLREHFRAEARRSRMTIEIVKLGQPKASPYAEHSPEERLAAAVH